MASRGSRIPLIALLVVEFLLLFFALEHRFSHQRWPVKTMTDATRARVRMVPVDTTVAALTKLARPEGPALQNERVPPYETTLYRVRARLIGVHSQLDRDLHLEIADLEAPDRTIVAEIPAPSQARGSGYEDWFARARAEVAEKTRGEKPRGGWLVRVSGVGFFDFTHFQPGAARSGFELHPVLEIEFLDRERPPPSAALDPARRKAGTEREAPHP